MPEDVHEEWRLEAVRRKISFGEVILEKAKVKKISPDEDFARILRKTAGSWGPVTDEQIKREAGKRKIELAASQRRKKSW